MTTIISVIIINLINYSIHKEMNKTLLIFNLFWLVSYTLSAGIINDMYFRHYEPEYFQMLIASFILVFNIVYIITSNVGKLDTSNSNPDISVNTKNFTIILSVLTVILSYFATKTLNYVLRGEFEEIRQLLHYGTVGTETSLFRNGFEVILLNWLASSMLLSLFIIVITLYFRGKINLSYLLWIFFLGLVYGIITAGRMILFKFLIIILIVVIFKEKSKNKEKFKVTKSTVFIVTVGILIISSLILISLYRNSDKSFFQILDSVLSYFKYPLVFNAYLLDLYYYKDNVLLGGLLGGILEPVYLLFKNHEEYSFLIFTEETKHFQYIYKNQLFNALPSMLYYFHRDGGFLGVMLYTALMSVVIAVRERKKKVSNSIKNQGLFILVLYFMLFGIIRWEPAFIGGWLAIIFIYIFSSNYFVPRGVEK